MLLPNTEAPSSKEEILSRVFGYASFREGQAEIIDAILAGRDALAVMPTGGGKSLCYQIPALLLPGVTLVISPLISLMKDQVAALSEAGVPAAYLNSSLSAAEAAEVFVQLRYARLKLLYVAPERLLAERFLAAVSDLAIPLVAVDEAHCISQWGQDFRPDYLRIADFLSHLPRRPTIAAFTATATARVREDVVRALRLQNPLQVVTSFDRPNLCFSVERPAARAKNPRLLALLNEREGKSGIVYCATRRNVEALCDALRAAGIPATRYHAGLLDEERRRNQEDFIFDRAPVMVATNAFGMGIDKSNVSFVIHYNMPKSIEEYYQEAGRAGRDGASADCILLFSQGDIWMANRLIEMDAGEGGASREALERLDKMIAYCKTSRCLRGVLLDYFGEAHPAHCGNCGNCAGAHFTRDATREAQMALSCVARVRERLGYDVGRATIERILHGSRSKRIHEAGLDRLSTYALLRARPMEEVRSLIDALLEEGYLEVEPTHRTLCLTPASWQILRGKTSFLLQVRADSPAPPAPPAAAKPPVA